MLTLPTCRWRRPSSVPSSGHSEVRDRIVASAELKLSPDLLISLKQPLPPPREQCRRRWSRRRRPIAVLPPAPPAPAGAPRFGEPA